MAMEAAIPWLTLSAQHSVNNTELLVMMLHYFIEKGHRLSCYQTGVPKMVSICAYHSFVNLRSQKKKVAQQFQLYS
jgi:hypothetical protein